MQHTKRKFLAGIATTVAVGAGATPVLGQSDHNVVCTEVNDEDEYIVYTNEGESTVDVSGYTVAVEYGSDTDQRRTLPDGTTIEAGATLTVATGAEDVEHDVSLNYNGPVLHNEEPDVVALLDTDGNEVCVTDQSATPTSTETETATEEPTETETETETETAEPTSTESETATETEGQTETETATETENVTETETETATETAEPTSTETETTATETATEETADDSDDDC